jgi:uncharacterized membrane protein YccC
MIVASLGDAILGGVLGAALAWIVWLLIAGGRR